MVVCKFCDGTGILDEVQFKKFTILATQRMSKDVDWDNVSRECPLCEGKGKIGFRQLLKFKKAERGKKK